MRARKLFVLDMTGFIDVSQLGDRLDIMSTEEGKPLTEITAGRLQKKCL